MRRRPFPFAASLLVAACLAPAALASHPPGSDPKVVFSRSGRNPGIFVMSSTGTNRTRLTTKQDSIPRWSPDGHRIAWLRYSENGHRIMVMNAGGRNKHRISTPFRRYTFPSGPAWSPDGSFIAYLDDDVDARPRVAQIRVATVSGDAERKLTRYARVHLSLNGQVWSSNLEQSLEIVYTNLGDGDEDVHVMFSDGTNKRKLTQDTRWQSEAVWQPGGTLLAFEDRKSPSDLTSQIGVIDKTGTGYTLLTDGSANDVQPVWSPDGSKIAFMRTVTQGQNQQELLMVMDADGGNLTDVTPQGWPGYVNYSWSQDGTKLIYSDHQDIYVVTIADASRRRLTQTQAPEFHPSFRPVPLAP